MEDVVWIIQTTLPGGWSEAMVGAWCFDLVENGFTACAQHSKIVSVYRWEGQVENEAEWRIQCKTDESRKQPLVDEIRSKHPYNLPMIISFEAQTTMDYADWVGKK
ncbi:MAG: divalent cation tolerance protein CutA [Candidatus Thermoplasmatota archaeon]|nr:divalent cation tolerance protein CutA [Candidatus Thermoplasmatota archaeon]MEE3303831.1 divalent cation tolerance protein CutA [Candidatus Thermoplasmatota archaeon]